MTTENTATRAGRIWTRIVKGLGIFAVVVLTLLVGAHYAWKYSGSNQWELEIDKNGVKIYTLKAPGSVLKRIRGVTRVRTTMNAAVAAMVSNDEEDCRAMFPSCKSIASIQPWRQQDLSHIHLYRLSGWRPFAAREILLKTQAWQDPATKAVMVSFMATPDELPQNPCCYRVSHMANIWRYTPLDNGEVEVEVRMNVDPGIPYVLFNKGTPSALYKVLSNLQKFLDNEKWQKFKYPQIEEKV